ncbi:MAG: CDP-alcohol phosphatidyltransferase family protein [Pseudomonadota bacterium]
MLDSKLRPYTDPIVEFIGRGLTERGVGANAVTWTGFGLGLAAAALIVFHFYWTALLFIFLSRMCDGLDGAVARFRGTTDLGGYLDIVLDFAFYGLIPLGFVLADPSANGVAGAVLLLTFYINGASFLAFAIMEEKRGTAEAARGSKSLVYTIGLAEATETYAAFAAFCLFPQHFASIAYIFAAIVAVTTISRVALAYRTLR